jgi:aspartate aminotransferase-like enzyme
MFGPNTVFDDYVCPNFNHRDKEFFELFSSVRTKFANTFGLQDYDILFIPGSASVGMESIIYSILNPIEVTGWNGSFTRRWKNLVSNYPKSRLIPKVNLYCLYETSCSSFYKQDDGLCIVDAVSAFPYYDIPKNNTLAFVTCLNKQLGSYPGLAVVGVRKDGWSHFKSNTEDQSYLNLARYKEYADKNQFPMTAPVYILQHFDKVLDTYDIEELKEAIRYRSWYLADIIKGDNLIGDAIGPTITVKPNVLPQSICERFSLYGYHAGRPNIQIFTYSETAYRYAKFSAALRKVL